jgi:hypothetical protein
MATFSLTTLGSIADFVNGAWSPDEYRDEGVPVVRVSDIRYETMDLSECKFLSRNAFEKYKRHVLATGDFGSLHGRISSDAAKFGGRARCHRAPDGRRCPTQSKCRKDSSCLL